jgi:hypothetical protein
MKKNILFFLFLLISHFALAQNVEEAAESEYIKTLQKASLEAIKQKDAAAFDAAAKNVVPPTSKAKAWSHARRAGLLFEIHEKILKDNDVNSLRKKEIVTEIMKNYQISIDSCVECSYGWRISRLEFLKECNLEMEMQKKELALLKEKGYKVDKQGIALGINVIKGKDIWIGGQLSFLTVNSPRYKIKQKDAQTEKTEVVAENKMPFGASFLPIALNYNTSKKTTEFAVSIIQINAPLMLDITKVGYRSGVKGEQGSGFYRPEIGLGIGSFSLSYGYNVWFNKTYRANEEKHLLQFRFTPILNSK